MDFVIQTKMVARHHLLDLGDLVDGIGSRDLDLVVGYSIFGTSQLPTIKYKLVLIKLQIV